jgi:metallo-beta-lactamase family protein
LYELRLAQREKLLPAKIPIYCPSPTAKEVTQLYREHLKSGWFEPEVAAKADAFSPREVLSTVPSADKLPRPCIIICTSDIVIAPWMRKLLSVLLPERTTSLVLVGYQFRGSAGELLLHGATKLDIDGQEVPCRAKVQAFSCFSGHADAADVDAWLVNIPKESTVVLVHGGVEELKTRAEQLQSRGYSRVIIAKEGERMELDSSKP